MAAGRLDGTHMVDPQVSRFWEAAIRSGLIDEAALRAATDAIPEDKRTADTIDRRIAREAVNAGRLTIWQAQQLLAGRWQGMRIDKYELQAVIGQGGMGRVYLARDTRLNRKVALKILSRERMNNPRALARFRREAKVGAQLQHENLVRIYDEGDANGVRYLVMEFIEGKNVGHLIADLGKIPPATAATLGRQVALGLEHLHQKGLLHRDVNPMNILIDCDGTAKLTDLGLAIDLGDMEDVVTRDGATVGTFDYISPEQARSSRSIGPRSDIYSLGCTLYHMMAGRVPFPMPSLPEKLYAHQLSEPEPLCAEAPDVPEGLAAVVARMMRKSPEDRYLRAVDAARALEPYIGGPLSSFQISSAAEGSNGAASGATPPGSDPDLQLKPGAVPPAPITPASGPLDSVFKIDLGPEPALSEIRSGVRPPAKPKAQRESWVSRFPVRKVLAALAGVAALAMVTALAIFLWNHLPSRSKTPGPQIGRAGTVPVVSTPDGLRNAIAIRYRGDQELPQTDLREAVRRVSGGGGEIVLRTTTPILVGDPDKSLRLGGGHLVIRAVDGAKPVLRVDLSNKAPWIEVDPQAKLSLIGLTIHAEVKPGESGLAPVLLACSGNVVLKECTFSLTGADRSARAVASEGLKAQFSGCFFEGFDRPLTLGVFPGGEVAISHCIFVRNITSDPLAGWAIAATWKYSPEEKSRRITVDRCTALGSGFLVAEGFTAADPLEVRVSQSAIRSPTLLMSETPIADLPKAIGWTGKDNAYSIGGPSWILLPPRGFDSPPGAPSDLKSWADLMKNDTGGRDEVLRFSGSSTGEGRVPEDFTVMDEPGKPPVGADPAKVGPGAKR